MQIVIERQKGFVRAFQSADCVRTVTYPFDYGYFANTGVNPSDNEPPDVFVGSGGEICGRFNKGMLVRLDDGSVVREDDELKWFCNMTQAEADALLRWWNTQDPRCPDLARDVVYFPTRQAMYLDVRDHSTGNPTVQRLLRMYAEAE